MTRGEPDARALEAWEDDLRTWRLSLRQRNRSPRTIRNYTESALLLREFLIERGCLVAPADVTREDVQEFIADQVERWAPSTAATRFRCIQQLFRHLEREGDIDRSTMANLSPPTIADTPVPVIPEHALRDLLKVCNGRGFDDRRDTAIIMLFIDTGIRLGELTALEVSDIDRELDVIRIIGKGGHGRTAPFGAAAGLALSRYLKVRRRHKHARLDALWLAPRGRLTDSGVAQMLRRRCGQAGIPRVNPHQFRHTFAHQWLVEGGGEQDLRIMAGWKSNQMLQRYGPPQPASAPGRRTGDSVQETDCDGRRVLVAGVGDRGQWWRSVPPFGSSWDFRADNPRYTTSGTLYPGELEVHALLIGDQGKASRLGSSSTGTPVGLSSGSTSDAAGSTTSGSPCAGHGSMRQSHSGSPSAFAAAASPLSASTSRRRSSWSASGSAAATT